MQASEETAAGRAMPPPSALARAEAAFHAGRIAEAERLCREALAFRPVDAAAFNLMALIQHRQGNLDAAQERLKEAITLAPDNAGYWYTLGRLALLRGELGHAAKAFAAAVARAPGLAEAHLRLGECRLRLGDTQAARASFAAAAARAADPRKAHAGAGRLLMQAGLAGEAIPHFRAWAEAAPSNAEAWRALGRAAFAADRPEAAKEAFAQALAFAPEDAETHMNLGVAAAALGETTSARVALERAVALAPASALARLNLGNVLDEAGEGARAKGCFEAALAIDPSLAEAHSNLATLLLHEGDFARAEAHFRRALALAPDYPEAHNNLAQMKLLQGDFADGWRGAEWRRRTSDYRARLRHVRLPRWQGEPVAGRTLLLWCEQGIGDEVQFVSLVPDLLAAGARVVLEGDRRMSGIYARSFPGIEVVARREPADERCRGADIAFQASLEDLLPILRPDPTRIPKPGPYLKADSDRATAMRATYQAGAGDKMLVGLSWRGGTRKSKGAARSTALADWLPVLGQEGIRFVSLQYGPVAEEIARFRAETGLEIVLDPAVDALADMESFFAQVAALDLVISIDNATVHVAGALGRPVWTLLPPVPSWRWLLGRSDCPWYPSMTLVRQREAGAWGPVMAEVAERLGALVAGRRADDGGVER
ncbi:MAG: tetratricopeptide repeat protein [Proteobacteria bacterium]|nr:tetratricopeptide repeat protein [Pseudomonadota bacterium]